MQMSKGLRLAGVGDGYFYWGSDCRRGGIYSWGLRDDGARLLRPSGLQSRVYLRDDHAATDAMLVARKEGSLDGTPRNPLGPPQPGAENQEALAEWMSFLYSELRRLASYYLQRERGNHTLQATALVHEAYLRLIDQRKVQWENRNQVIGVAAQLMRRVLVDYSRSHRAAKRGGEVKKVYLQEAEIGGQRGRRTSFNWMKLSLASPNSIRSKPDWSSCGSSGV